MSSAQVQLRKGSVATRIFLVVLISHLIGFALLFSTDPDVGWALSWVVTAVGSATLVSGVARLVSWLGSSLGWLPVGRRIVMASASAGFAAGWLFSILGGALISFHPWMLAYIVFFGGTGLAAGLALGFLMSWLAKAVQQGARSSRSHL